MRRASLLFASFSAFALAMPAAAQADPHAGHGASAPMAPAREGGASGCTPEHAAMGHCTMDNDVEHHGAHGDTEMQADPGEHMDDGAHAAMPANGACTPEHAAMGHCTPREAITEGHGEAAVGTDLPPGDAPAPPPPSDWYADRIYPASEMEHSRHQMMKENGAQTFGFINLDFEYQARKGHDGLSWEGEAWYGNDIDRLTIKSEGESEIGEGLEEGEVQLLYSRAIGPYFNAQAGVRQDFGGGPDRSYATLAIEGLAPYWFEVEGALFLSDKGDVLARVEGEYDQRITQRLVLQPAIEVNFSLQDMPANGIGSGLSDVELGLRLRYAIVPEFAPYIGVEWSRKFGDTARFARLAGESVESTSFVVGVRAWF